MLRRPTEAKRISKASNTPVVDSVEMQGTLEQGLTETFFSSREMSVVTADPIPSTICSGLKAVVSCPEFRVCASRTGRKVRSGSVVPG